MSADIIITIIGIIGVIILGIDILLEVMNKLRKDHKIFTTLYVVANLFLFLYSLNFQIWLFVWLNGFLLLIGLYSYYIAHFENHKK